MLWTMALAQDNTVTNSGMSANNAVSGTLLTALTSNVSNASALVSDASSARFECINWSGLTYSYNSERHLMCAPQADTNGSVRMSATNLTVALSVFSPASVNDTARSDCNTLVEIFTTGAVTAFAPLCALGAIIPRAATLGSKAYSAP